MSSKVVHQRKGAERGEEINNPRAVLLASLMADLDTSLSKVWRYKSL